MLASAPLIAPTRALAPVRVAYHDACHLLHGQRIHDAPRALLRSIPQRDQSLGGRRPETVSSLVAAIEDKLDAARRLQLARDRWAMRAPAFDHYKVDIARPLYLFRLLQPGLENIKSLSGSTPSSLNLIERTAASILKLAREIVRSLPARNPNDSSKPGNCR